eukprot:COSAG01_NODE_12649_length_1704_cov_1.520249_2_plen_84_part_00
MLVQRVEGRWEEEVTRVLDGRAASDWAEGRVGGSAQRAMVRASTRLSEGTFGRASSAQLPPAGAIAPPLPAPSATAATDLSKL